MASERMAGAQIGNCSGWIPGSQKCHRPAKGLSTQSGATQGHLYSIILLGDSMMSQQVLKPHNPSSLLAPKGQVACVFTGGHRHARVARTLINSSKASKGGSSDENAVLSSGMLTADHSNTIRDSALMLFGICLKISR